MNTILKKCKIRDCIIFLFYLLSFFFFIKPDYFSYMGSFTQLYNMGFIIFFGIILCLIIKKRIILIDSIIIILITIYPIIVSILKSVSLEYSIFLPVFQVIAITTILDYGLSKHFDKCLSAITLILEIYTYINFITVIFCENGMAFGELYTGKFWFLGYKNVMIRFLIPAIFCNSVNSVFKKGRISIRTVSIIIISIITQILVDCKTGLIGIGILVIMMFIFSKKKLPKIINAKTGIIVLIILSLLLATTHLMDSFSNILSSMGETVSVAHRQNVWKRAIELIVQSPIFGYGLRSNDGYRVLISLSTGWGYFSHPHNYLLNTLLQGGVVLLIFVVLLIIRMSKKCIVLKENFAAKMLIITYVAFFIMGISESLIGTTLLYPLALFANAFSTNSIIYKREE